MGGRSRRVQQDREPFRGDRWEWLGELNQDRLNNYGWMARSAQFEGEGDHRLQKEALFGEVCREWERRYGERPPFYMDSYERSERLISSYRDEPTLYVSDLKQGKRYLSIGNGKSYEFLGTQRGEDRKNYFVFQEVAAPHGESTGEIRPFTSAELKAQLREWKK